MTSSDKSQHVTEEMVDAQKGLEYKLQKKKNNGLIYAAYWHVCMKFAIGFKALGVRANVLSWFSLIFYVLAGALFYYGTYTANLLGAVSFFLGIVVDTTDGKLARLSDDCSYFGIWLEYNIDYVRYICIYPPIAFALLRDNGEVYPMLFAFAAVGFSLTGDIINLQWRQFPFAAEEKERHTRESWTHKVMKEFYWTEGIEPLIAIIAAFASMLEWYLGFWALLMIAKYGASALLWGRVIVRKDVERKAPEG